MPARVGRSRSSRSATRAALTMSCFTVGRCMCENYPGSAHATQSNAVPRTNEGFASGECEWCRPVRRSPIPHCEAWVRRSRPAYHSCKQVRADCNEQARRWSGGRARRRLSSMGGKKRRREARGHGLARLSCLLSVPPEPLHPTGQSRERSRSDYGSVNGIRIASCAFTSAGKPGQATGGSERWPTIPEHVIHNQDGRIMNSACSGVAGHRIWDVRINLRCAVKRFLGCHTLPSCPLRLLLGNGLQPFRLRQPLHGLRPQPLRLLASFLEMPHASTLHHPYRHYDHHEYGEDSNKDPEPGIHTPQVPRALLTKPGGVSRRYGCASVTTARADASWPNRGYRICATRAAWIRRANARGPSPAR